MSSGNKPGPKTPAARLALLERRKNVAALYVKGSMQWEIGRAVGIAQQTVSTDLAAIRKEWRASTTMDFAARLDQELAKLDRVEAEAWAEWERSKKDAETRNAKTVTAPDTKDAKGVVVPGAVRSEQSQRDEGQCGDPRYLAEVRACVRQRCELLGLIVAKHAATTPDGQESYPPLEALVAALQRGEAANADPGD